MSDNQIISGIKERVLHQHNSFNIAVTGAPGSGKSSVAITLAMALSGKRFKENYKKFIVIGSVRDLLDLANSGTLKRGDVIVFDEGEQQADNRMWHSSTNKALYRTMQIWRYKGYIFITTMTSFSNLDLKVKKLINMLITPKAIIRNKKRVKSRIYNLFQSTMKNNTYYKHPYINGRFIRTITTSLPPSHIWRWYLRNSAKSKNQLMKTYHAELYNKKKKKPDKVPLEVQLDNAVKLIKKGEKQFKTKKGSFDRDYIRIKTGLKTPIIRAALMEINKEKPIKTKK